MHTHTRTHTHTHTQHLHHVGLDELQDILDINAPLGAGFAADILR